MPTAVDGKKAIRPVLMPSVKTSEYVTLTEACKLIPGRPSLGCVRRWAEHGYRGVYLTTWRVGARRVTTISEIDRFMNRTAAMFAKDKPDETAEHTAAKAALDAEGV